MRAESDHPCKSAQVGGWIHKLGEPVQYVPPPKPKVRPVAQENFAPLAEQCRCALLDSMKGLEDLSRTLGLSVEYLEEAGAGWLPDYCGNPFYRGYTFPMFDGHRRIIGIQIRTQHGKRSVPGSHGGLFWPKGVLVKGTGPLLLPEGATSCGACRDLCYDAIGRFSCNGRMDLIQELLAQARRDVVIVADHDEAKQRPDGSVFYPGQQGAAKIAAVIKPLCRTLKIVKPPFVKDMRDWLKAGATKAVVDCVIKAARFV
jgi:hypothetical protein